MFCKWGPRLIARQPYHGRTCHVVQRRQVSSKDLSTADYNSRVAIALDTTLPDITRRDRRLVELSHVGVVGVDSILNVFT